MKVKEFLKQNLLIIGAIVFVYIVAAFFVLRKSEDPVVKVYNFELAEFYLDQGQNYILEIPESFGAKINLKYGADVRALVRSSKIVSIIGLNLAVVDKKTDLIATEVLKSLQIKEKLLSDFYKEKIVWVNKTNVVDKGYFDSSNKSQAKVFKFKILMLIFSFGLILTALFFIKKRIQLKNE